MKNERGAASMSMADIEMMSIQHTFSSKVDDIVMTSEEQAQKHKRKVKRVEQLVRLIAGTSTVLCVISLLTAESFIVVISMLIGAVGSPWIIFLQHKLTGIGTLRGSLNMLRHTFNILGMENLKLSDSVERLHKNVDKLSITESVLGKTLEREGSTMEEFSQMIKSNQLLYEKIKVCAK